MANYAVNKKTGKPIHGICYSELTSYGRSKYSLGTIDYEELPNHRCVFCGGPFTKQETSRWLDLQMQHFISRPLREPD